MTLQPGETGHFSLIYLPGDSASGDMSVNKLIITPPNDYTQAEVTWNQSVLLQDGATRPGTYITPVVAWALTVLRLGRRPPAQVLGGRPTSGSETGRSHELRAHSQFFSRLAR